MNNKKKIKEFYMIEYTLINNKNSNSSNKSKGNNYCKNKN